MYDVTFLIPDYSDWQDEEDFMPPCPEDEMTDQERERLDMELYQMVDRGAFDPDNEIVC